MLEPTLSNGPHELILQEELIPTGEVGSLLLAGGFLGFLVIGAVHIVGHQFVHGYDSYLKYD